MFLPFLKRGKLGGGGNLRFLNINLYLVSLVTLSLPRSSTYSIRKIMTLWNIFTTSLG